MKTVVRRLLPVAIIGVGAVALVAMIKLKPEVKPAPREIVLPLVRALEITPTNHQFRVRTQGTVSPRTEINLIAEVPGRIVTIAPAFTQGGFFAAGEVLLAIDARDYELAVTRARAALAEAQTRLQREQAEADIARDEWKRLGQGEPSPLLLREPQLAEAAAIVESARASRQIAERDLERCQVKAPFAGCIRRKQADIGQYVNRGELLARIYAVDYAEVRLPLALDEVGYLDLPVRYDGLPANDAGPGAAVRLSASIGQQVHEWPGRIVRTEGEIDTRTRMITAVARVDDPYARSVDWKQPPLAVGLFVDAEIQGVRAENVYVAPRAAFRMPDTLLVVDAETRMRFRHIEVLRLEPDYVVFRGGMQTGDRVCGSPLEVITQGMQVRVIDDEPAPAAAAPEPQLAQENRP
ncbi:MAG: efflux RND transporter periplasmic adaptor subunit [Verrucomicrobiales bacterium]|nr:efflux RND transporter periplasmic adaptor subunit [Verrucomicrobiales bacterium]MCP5527872.1 efflux RND transporter periplasmic adaptor subunit [Verrucomicrobiales bacterium]